MPFVHGKSLGQKRPLFADFAVPLPQCGPPSEPVAVSDLVALIVRDQIRKFQDRQTQRLFLHALTEPELVAGAEQGKIISGTSDVPLQPVDCDEAVESALQAFQDGLYLIVIDGQQIESLEHRLTISAESHITFIRLTLLAGG